MNVRGIQISVTPAFPVYLAGYTRRESKVSAIETELELNICQLKTAGANVILASFDLLFATEALQTYFEQTVRDIFIESAPEHIILNASHTHYAPCIDERTTLGPKDEQYFEFLKQKIYDALIQLNSKAYSSCEMQLEQYQFDKILANRRRPIKTKLGSLKIVMEPVENDRPNEVLSVVSFLEQDKALVKFAIFACHPTNLFDREKISAEYIHHMRSSLRIDETPILFMQGFSGDTRAFPPDQYKWHRKVLSLLGRSYPVRYYRFNEKQYYTWIKKLYASINVKNRVLFERSSIKEMSVKADKIPVKSLGFINNIAPNLEITLLDLEKFSILFMSAEVLSGYLPKIESLSSKRILGVSYTGNCFGYLPTAENVEQGGYEVEEFKKGFDIEGNWKAGFESIIIEKIKALNI